MGRKFVWATIALMELCFVLTFLVLWLNRP